MSKSIIIISITTVVLILCCGCISCKKLPKGKMDESLNVQVDDSVKLLLGDSIANVIFEADSVRLLKLAVSLSKENQSDVVINSDSVNKPDFHDCYIARDFGYLTKTDIRPLMFILSDRSAYYNSNIRVKSPFLPDVALIFKKGQEQIDIMFSFTGGQMYIFTSNGNKIYEKYYYERLVLVFFQQYLKEENIKSYLDLNIY